MTQNQSMMKDLLPILNGAYKTPGKLLLWAMAIAQWIVVIFFGTLLFGFLGYLIFSLGAEYKKNTNVTHTSTVLKEKYIDSELIKIDNMMELLELQEHSLNERQNILESFIKTRHGAIHQEDYHPLLEQHVESLSAVLTECQKTKEKYKSKFSKLIKYFENSKTLEERYTDDVSKEDKRWEALCSLCQGELTTAQSELNRYLNGN